MNKLIIVALMCLGLTGCSFLPRITFDKPGATPTQTSKSQKDERCAGEYKVDPTTGSMTYCSKGYVNREQNFSQKDRTYTAWERVCNWARGLTFWGIPLFIGLIVFVPGFGGWLIGTIFHRGWEGVSALVKGIAEGKKYVRANGTKYTDKEREAYNQGANDILMKIDENIKDQKIRDLIYLERAKLKN